MATGRVDLATRKRGGGGAWPGSEELAALARSWAAEMVQRGLAAATRDPYGRVARAYLVFLESSGVCCLSEADGASVLAFLASLRARWAVSSLPWLISNFRPFLKFAGRPDLVDALALAGVRRHHTILPVLDDQDLEAVVEARGAQQVRARDAAITLLAVTTGLRACDLVSLRLVDVDWRTQTIAIVQQKTHNPLTVPLAPLVGSRLADYILDERPASADDHVFLRVKAPHTRLGDHAAIHRLVRHNEVLAVLRRAVEAGVNHIDTAQYYGPDVSNELIHAALHPYPDDLALVSKVGARRDEKGAWLPWDAPDELRQGIEDNLASLQVEQLAAVNLRVFEGAPPEPDQKFADQLGAMIQAKDDGLIAGIGLSTITLAHLRYALEQTDIACVQNPYNLLERGSQSVLELCIERGIAVVPYFPLGSAFHAKNPVLTQPEVLVAADRLGHTPAQVVLAWTLSVAPNILVIPGTSSLAHLEENLAVTDLELDRTIRTALDSLA